MREDKRAVCGNAVLVRGGVLRDVELCVVVFGRTIFGGLR